MILDYVGGDTGAERSEDDHWTTIACVNSRKPAETDVTAVDVETDNDDNRDDCCCCSSSDDNDEESGSDETEDENEDEDYYYEGDEEQPGAAVEELEPRRSPIARYFSLVKKYYKTFQRSVKALVEHKYFQQGLLGAILINTLSMGIEYHNQVCRAWPHFFFSSSLFGRCTLKSEKHFG